MHATDNRPDRPVVYPESDGQPMADNTKQFQWIVTIKENLDARLPDFVAGDLLWYPVEGNPKIRQAPDALVAFGRPKGHRGSYRQWEEGGVAPQVVFEITSPGNRAADSLRKFSFYQQYGVEEFYVYDPDEETLDVWLRRDGRLVAVEDMNRFVSPRLGVRFEMDDTLVIFDANGDRFLTFSELMERSGHLAAERDREKQRADQETQRADQEKQRADALAAKLRELGVEP
jgi:Uma2 family endonuclease